MTTETEWPDPAFCTAILDLDAQYYQCRLAPAHVSQRGGHLHVHAGEDSAGQSFVLTWEGDA